MSGEGAPLDTAVGAGGNAPPAADVPVPGPAAAPPAAGLPTPRLARAVARATPPAGAYRRVTAAAAAAGGVGGALVLAGWAFDVASLRQLAPALAPGLRPMAPMTAASVVLLALALWLLRPRPAGAAGPRARRVALACAAAVLALALVVAAEWATGRALGVDLLLFPDAVRAAATGAAAALPPGRMAVNTAVALTALALGVLLLDAPLPPRHTLLGAVARAARGAAGAVGTLVPYLALVGYVYGVRPLYDPAGLLGGMALQTAALLTALGVGLTLARPGRGMARLLTGDDAGGLLLRRALPVAVAVPALFGLVGLAGVDRGWWGHRAGTAGLVLALTLVTGQSLVRAAVRARALDGERARSLQAARAQAQALGAAARAREATAAALAAREAEFRAMADNIPQLAWMADATGWIFWYNARWYEYTGSTYERMQGWGWQAVHHPDHVERVTQRFRAAVQAAGAPWEDTFPLRRHDGAWRWFLSRANPIRNADGRVVRWFGTNTDVTEQREARAAAEAASRAKSQFLATMSHELRTPLNAIGGHVQLVEMGIHGPVTPAQAEALGRVTRAQRHLLGLINDVLNLSRIEAGRVEYRLADVPAAELAADVTGLVESQLAAKGLAFAVELPESPEALVTRADREKAGQVLLNLLSNAVKFTPAGGRVTLEGRAAEDAAGLPTVELAVRDTGVGIPDDQLGRIFEPFVQVDGGLTRAHEGTGLGLAISRDLARGMGGDLHVRSVAGQGSVFTLVLPRVLPSDPEAERRTGEERRDGQRRELGERRTGEERRQEEEDTPA